MSLETIEADVEEYAERVAGGLAKDIQVLEQYVVTETKVIWPYIKAAIVLLLSQEGQAALKAEVAVAPVELAAVTAGNVPVALATAGSAVIAALTTTVGANAAADAQVEIAAEQAGSQPVTQ